jgi:type I restriction enzyme S subunit
VARLETGHTPSRGHPEYWDDGDIPWIGIRDATANHGRTLFDTQQHTNELGIANSSARVLPANTVCLSRTASVGYVVVMGRPMATSQDFVNWVCSERELDHRFLKYVLLAERESFLSFASGTTHQTIYFPEVKAFHVCLPSINQQRRIADVLSAVDDLIENNRRRIELLEQMAQVIYREWFVHFRYPGHDTATFVDSTLGPIPEGWRSVVSAELIEAGSLEIGDGYRAKNSEMLDAGRGLAFVRVADVRDGHLDLSRCDQLPVDYVDRLRGKVGRPGDSVICMKGTVGRCALADEALPPMVYSPQVSYWRSLEPDLVPPAYLYSWIRSEDFRQQCAAVKGATDMADYVNLKDQRRMRLLLPDAETTSRFAASISPLLRLVSSLRFNARVLGSTRDHLLPRLVSGRIDVSALDLDSSVKSAP